MDSGGQCPAAKVLDFKRVCHRAKPEQPGVSVDTLEIIEVLTVMVRKDQPTVKGF